jgi:hypothetical protein
MVGQQRERLDRLGSFQQARGTRPRVWPSFTYVWRRWCDLVNRAFRHVALDRRKAIEMMFADAIGEYVFGHDKEDRNAENALQS